MHFLGEDVADKIPDDLYYTFDHWSLRISFEIGFLDLCSSKCSLYTNAYSEIITYMQ